VITAKFTDKEMQVIRPIIKHEGWTKNQFVRVATLAGVVTILTDYMTRPGSPISKMALPAIKKFQESHSIEEAIEEGKRIETSLSPEDRKLVEELLFIRNESIKAFKEHQPRGRIKVKRKRGRPVDEGIK
jgi:hypothetical protein